MITITVQAAQQQSIDHGIALFIWVIANVTWLNSNTFVKQNNHIPDKQGAGDALHVFLWEIWIKWLLNFTISTLSWFSHKLESVLGDSKTWIVLLKKRKCDPKISLLNAKMLLMEKVFSCRGVLRIWSHTVTYSSIFLLTLSSGYMHTHTHGTFPTMF